MIFTRTSGSVEIFNFLASLLDPLLFSMSFENLSLILWLGTSFWGTGSSDKTISGVPALIDSGDLSDLCFFLCFLGFESFLECFLCFFTLETFSELFSDFEDFLWCFFFFSGSSVLAFFVRGVSIELQIIELLVVIYP